MADQLKFGDDEVQFGDDDVYFGVVPISSGHIDHPITQTSLLALVLDADPEHYEDTVAYEFSNGRKFYE